MHSLVYYTFVKGGKHLDHNTNSIIIDILELLPSFHSFTFQIEFDTRSFSPLFLFPFCSFFPLFTLLFFLCGGNIKSKSFYFS